MAATNPIWTPTTLAAHLRGELSGDENAAGGTVPDRVMNLTVQSGKDLWTNVDWIFRRKQGTLALVADDADKDVPSDFAELDQRWMRDNENTGVPIVFTQDIGRWQAKADTFEDDYTAEPQLIAIVRDTGETSSWDQHFVVTPTSDDSYNYDYWYLVSDPWTSGVMTDDTTAPLWPPSFHEGWRLLGRWKILRAFSTKERADTAAKEFREWLDHQLAENNENITTANEFIRDGYGDVDGFLSQQQYPFTDTWARFPS